MAIEDYSTTAALNTSINGTSVAELCAAGNLNNAIRELMADLATYLADSGGSIDDLQTAVQNGTLSYTGAAGGTGDALTATLAPVPAALVAGIEVLIKASATNTTAATLNLNSLGAKNILSAGAALTAGMIVSARLYRLAYDGAVWNMLTPDSAALPVARGGTGSTTAAAAFASLAVAASALTGTGYIKFANGLFLMWGSKAYSGGGATTTIAYNTELGITTGIAAFSRAVITGGSGSDTQANGPYVSACSVTGFTVSTTSGTTASTLFWFAVGA